MNHTTEILRLASLLATARVRRYRAHDGNSGWTEIAQAEQRVVEATAELEAGIAVAKEHWKTENNQP